MTINAILAIDKANGIGRNGELPWPRNDADMKWFYDCTKNNVVVMGSNTWRSIGNKKLPNRINIVCTNGTVEGDPDRAVSVPHYDTLKFLQNLKMEYPSRKIWIIGGAKVYTQMIPYCDHLYLTVFDNTYDCDTFIDPSLLAGFTVLTSQKTIGECNFSIWSRL